MVLFIIFGAPNIIIRVLLLEVISWLFRRVFTHQNFKYLIVQSVFFIVIVTGVIINSFIVIVTGVIIKIGIFPFHFWLLNILNKEKDSIWIFIITLHKFAPLLLVLLLFLEGRYATLLILLIFRGVILIETNSIFFIFSISSSIHTVWIVIGGLQRKKIYFFYFFLYSILVWIILKILINKILLYKEVNQNSVTRYIWLVLSGLPPFSLFWLKLNVLTLLTYLLIISLLTVSILVLFCYFRCYQISLFFNPFYKNLSFSWVLIIRSVFFIY